MASPAGREPDRGTEYELKSKNRLEAVAVPSTLRQHTPSAHCTSPRRSSALRRQGKIAAKMDAHKLIAALKGGSKGIPRFKTENTLGDYSRCFSAFDTETDVKTKIMILSSNPKAYNLDKMLEFLANSRSV